MKKVLTGLLILAVISLTGFATTFDTIELSDVLTFSDGGTIDNTAADTLTITETNIVLAGSVSFSGAVEIDSLEVGGGYGSTGVSISAAGVIQADGALTIEDVLTFSDGATIDNTAADTVTVTEDNIDLVGALAADAVTVSDVLTFSDGGTIDNTAGDTLTITETNITLAGVALIDGGALTLDNDAELDNTTNADYLYITETNIDLVGASLADTLTLSDVLTFSDGATIDNTAADDLTITETNIILTGAVDISSGTVDRAALTEDALAVYGIPISLFRQEDGIPLAVGETADTFCLDYSANVWLIYGEESLSETETSEGSFQFVLPPEYVSAGDIKVRIKHRVTGAGTLGATATIDVEMFEQDGEGAIGSDLVSTAAQDTTKASWTTSDFTVDGSGLVAGDILNVVVTSAIQESAGSAVRINLDGVAILLDIKG